MGERFAASGVPKDPLNFIGVILDPYPRYVSAAFLVCFFTLGTAYAVGNGEASRKKLYPTLVDAPSFAVIRTYGDLVIAAGYDRETKALTGELKLLSLKDTKELNFKVEQIGPLSAPADSSKVAAPTSSSGSTTLLDRSASAPVRASSAPPSATPKDASSAPKL